MYCREKCLGHLLKLNAEITQNDGAQLGRLSALSSFIDLLLLKSEALFCWRVLVEERCHPPFHILAS